MLDVVFTAGQRVLWSPAGDGKDSLASMAGPMHHLCRSKKLLTAFHIKAAVDAAQAYGVGPAPGGACQLASWLEPGACLLPVPVPVVVQVSAVGNGHVAASAGLPPANLGPGAVATTTAVLLCRDHPGCMWHLAHSQKRATCVRATSEQHLLLCSWASGSACPTCLRCCPLPRAPSPVSLALKQLTGAVAQAVVSSSPQLLKLSMEIFQKEGSTALSLTLSH